jgi:hypothetical protein
MDVDEIKFEFFKGCTNCMHNNRAMLLTMTEIWQYGIPVCQKCGEKLRFNARVKHKEMYITKGTLVIEGVNFKLLEKQRLELVGLSLGQRSVSECDALEGIIEMLDVWSDKRLKEMKDV